MCKSLSQNDTSICITVREVVHARLHDCKYIVN